MPVDLIKNRQKNNPLRKGNVYKTIPLGARVRERKNGINYEL